MNNTINLPSCYYYPTAVTLVDDDQPFLTNMCLGLDDKLSYQVYTDPYLALEKIESTQHVNACLQACITSLDPIDIDNHAHNNQPLSVDVNLIHQEIYHRQRFDEMTVLLIDYAMPSMNGVEFCQKLKSHPIKKIMVTGQADASIAIDAFNQGIIDQFIMKNSGSFFDQVNQAISQAQKAYFAEASKTLLTNIKTDPNCALGLTAFQSFFQSYLQQYHFSEYYLVDSTGSFLFCDYSGRLSWLIVKSNAEIDHYTEIAVESGAASSVVHALRERKKIPFFFSQEDTQVSVSEWGRYCHTAMPIPGCPDHYYAVSHHPGLYSVYPDEILSHKEYLSQFDSIVNHASA